MNSLAYYNENDPKAAAWLRELIKAGLIAAGEVDERSIDDVAPADLTGFRQCHFFAGIGGWSYALRLAGWPDDRPVWTGSCPCQPFSVAGAGKGTDDERHLWPAFRWLIDQRRPAVVFGEQVASKSGRHWLAGVRADMEAMGYGVGAADLCAAGVGAPHIRQRLFWIGQGMDDAASPRQQPAREGTKSEARHETRRRRPECGRDGSRVDDAECDAAESRRVTDESREGAGTAQAGPHAKSGRRGVPRGMGYTSGEGAGRDTGAVSRAEKEASMRPVGDGVIDAGAARGMGHAIEPRLEGHAGHEPDRHQPGRLDADPNRPTAKAGGDRWSDAIWIPCADGKARRIKPGLKPLADGLPGRVGLLRGYGNAIVPQLAAAFIEATN